MKIRRPDGCVHYSDLTRIAASPLHYKCAVERAGSRVVTRGMRIGTIAHRLILGARPGHQIVTWDGQRRGKAWDAFRTEHEAQADDIVTLDECIEAQAIADAALEHPALAELVHGDGMQFEVPLRWLDAGIECATSGVDILGRGILCDLKTTRTVDPEQLQRQAFRSLYHGQLAFYLEGARQNGHRVERVCLAAIEALPPHDVVVLDADPALLEEGRRDVVLWLERLRACEADDYFPGRAAQPVPWGLPIWKLAGLDAEQGEGDAGDLDGAEEGAAA